MNLKERLISLSMGHWIDRKFLGFMHVRSAVIRTLVLQLYTLIMIAAVHPASKFDLFIRHTHSHTLLRLFVCHGQLPVYQLEFPVHVGIV